MAASSAGAGENRAGRRSPILRIAALLLIFGCFIGIQATRLSVPPWDRCEYWRESDTYCMALNYVQYDMHLLRPQLNYDGIADNYAQLELQIIPYLSALIFRLLHTTSWMIPRLLSLLCFLGSAVFLFLLMRRFTGFVPSCAGLACYLYLPLSMLMAASIQPEACTLLFLCGTCFFLKLYQDRGKAGFMLAAAAMTAFGIMEKTPFAFIGLLFLYVFFASHGLSTFKMPLTYAAAVLALLPPVLLIAYTSSHSVFRFIDGIAEKHILTDQLLSIFTKKGIEFFHTAARDYFGWGVLFFALAGLFLSLKKERRFCFFLALAFLLETVTIVAVIQFKYYLIFLLPVTALLFSLTVDELGRCRKAVPLVLCAGVLLFTLGRDRACWEQTEVHVRIDRAGRFIAEHSSPDEGLAIAEINPAYFNAANRRGYRANIKYYPYIPVGAEAEIAYFIDHGVTKFIVVNGAVYDDPENEYQAYLDAHFPVAVSCDYCVIYDLTGGGAE